MFSREIFAIVKQIAVLSLLAIALGLVYGRVLLSDVASIS